MRTARTVRPQSRSVSAATAIPRAVSLAEGAHASSRSRKTRSAPELGAFSHMRSLLAGVASSERRARSARTSDDTVRPQFGESIGVDAEEVTEHGVVVRAETAAEVLDPARCLAEHGNRCVHRHRAEVGIVDLDEKPARPEVLIGQE